MFVTDTVDAVYRPEAWIPEAVMDQLAEIIVDLPDLRVRHDYFSAGAPFAHFFLRRSITIMGNT